MPFNLYLPEWMPQSHLCFNTPEVKKPQILNTFKVRYNVIACIESINQDENGVPMIVECEKKGVTDLITMEKMLFSKRITIVTPEFSEPLMNQEIQIEGKIR